MGALERIVGRWGPPPEGGAWCALAIAALFTFLAIAPRNVRDAFIPQISRRMFLTVSAFAAAWLSLAYVAFYLRGGPRIVDATTYWLQARALAEGHFAWPVPEPSASFRGRFLLFDDGDSPRLAGIFPPGYPLLLACGFVVGAPMVVGPALAAALVVATFALAREIALHMRLARADAEPIARAAALVSIACAALRYHTADTMAHGASALGVTLALTSALHARRLASTHAHPFFALAGLAVGYVAATRLASALPIACVVLFLAYGTSPIPGARHAGGRRRAIASVLLGMIPGLALLLVAQKASLGDALASTQRAYYAVSDGPPGCFRYGFGSAIGCQFEHGDFIRAHAIDRDGYGLLAALGTSGRRLKMHLADVANFEPLALLVLVPIVRARRTFGPHVLAVQCCAALIFGQIAAYTPFYFDGNYPGGGARFFADVLPVEHVLLALSLLTFLPRIALPRKATALLAIACAGFAVHTSFAHDALADREGGRPLFEPDVFADNALTRGLVFVESDHAFDLAHDPASASDLRAAHHVIVARLRHDDHDRLLDEKLGWPNAFVYRFKEDRASPSTVADLARPSHTIPFLEPYASSPASVPTWRFESESDWPPLAQHGGWAAPVWASTTCASNGRVLALFADARSPSVETTIALPVPRDGRWTIAPQLLHGTRDLAGVLRLVRETPAPRAELAAWSWPAAANPSVTCSDLTPRVLTLTTGEHLALILSLASRGDARNEIEPNSAEFDAKSDMDGLRPALDKTTLTEARP